ncbi:hypothetical protein BOS5A_211414 [Bosea sp. EC-HK365B]|nr:hypothetical protein BOSE21B_50277 [Bosea sp. 21B]VVT60623.1 hypothetical protein BOS5A_211414 [Bosea sp. EC-HK365B]VXB68419.1 hypothetical protein BOSE127_140353 [Bosea sp. 127]
MSSQSETARASSQLTVGGGTSLTCPGPEAARTASASTTTGSTTRQPSASGFAASAIGRTLFPGTPASIRTQALPSVAEIGLSSGEMIAGAEAGFCREAGRGGGRGAFVGFASWPQAQSASTNPAAAMTTTKQLHQMGLRRHMRSADGREQDRDRGRNDQRRQQSHGHDRSPSHRPGRGNARDG